MILIASRCYADPRARFTVRVRWAARSSSLPISRIRRAFAVSAQAIASDTKDGGLNYTVNGMVNLPLADKLALRIVGTDSYTGGWIDRIVLNPFPLETNGGFTRGNVLAAPGGA